MSLASLRHGASTLIVKVLLLLLVLSFVLWGVGDMLRGGNNNTMAKVGKNKISRNEFETILKRELQFYQNMMGGSISEEQLKQLGIEQNVLQALIQRNLLQLRQQELDVTIGEETVKNIIKSSDAFTDENQHFSKERFMHALRTNGLTESAYIESLKEDIALRIFIEALTVMPTSLRQEAELLLTSRNQVARADILTIPADAIVLKQKPKESELLETYQRHQGNFIVPEIREVTYLTFTSDTLVEDIKISEEELRQYYDNHDDRYQLPEKRKVLQYNFASKEAAQQGYTALSSGNEYTLEKNDLGIVTKEGLLDSLQEPVFSLEEGKVSQPVQTALGWHVFIVEEIFPASRQTFDQAKENIDKQLQKEHSADMVYHVINQLEDSLSAGETLEELAEKFALPDVQTVKLNSAGKGSKGQRLEGLPDPENFVPLAFASALHSPSAVTALSDNRHYLILRVDSITPSHMRALDEVKGKVIQLWEKETKEKQLYALAEELTKQVTAENPINVVAQQNKMELLPNQIITKAEGEELPATLPELPDALQEEILQLAIGQVSKPYLEKNGAMVIAQLRSITQAELSQQEREQHLSDIENELKKQFVDEIFMQYLNFLRQKYPVNIYQSQMIEPSSAVNSNAE